MLNLLRTTIFLSGSLNLFLGLLVLKRNSKSIINRNFFILAFTTALWIGTNFTVLFFHNVFLLRLMYSTGALCISSYLGWMLIFCRKDVRAATAAYSAGLIAAALSLTPFVVTRLKHFSITGTEIKYGSLFPLFAVFTVINTVLFFALFFLNKKAKGSKRHQTHFILFGTVLFAFWVTLVDIILPSFGIYKLYMLDSPGSLFFVAFAAYAIVKHRLMDIRLVVLRSAAYSILVALFAGSYVLLISFMRSTYADNLDMNSNVVFVVAGLIAAFGFQPLRRMFERITDRIFYKKRYNPQKLLGELNTAMSTTLDLDSLTKLIIKALSKDMRLSKVAILLDGKKEREEIKGEGFNIPRLSFEKVMSVCSNKKIVVADEQEEDSREKAILRKFDISVLVPLVVENELIGLLIFGNKLSGDMYTVQDVEFLEILAPEAAIAIKNAELFEEKAMRVRELGALNKLAFTLGTDLNLETILDQALKQIMFVTDADSGSIMLREEKENTLVIKAAKAIKKEVLKKTRVEIGEGIAGWVAKNKEPLILVDDLDPRFQDELKRQEIISAITVPLIAKEKVIGVLSVNRNKSPELFSKENLNVVNSFAGQLAVAIENARLYQDLESTFLGAISALAAAVDAKDSYTYGHSNDVTKYAVKTAKQLLLPKSEIETIRIAAILHDIGKIGIDASILNKNSSLSPKERTIINRHPAIGVNILESLEFLKDAIPLILFHHERFDGQGYPSGITDSSIPLGARIIAVADSFNAMISDRPYRKAMSVDKAIKELEDNAGTQFDPKVVDAFLKVLTKNLHQEKTSRSPNRKKLVLKK